jgi:hypothetical protein
MYKQGENDDWTHLHHIVGFDYEEGYEYVLLVRMVKDRTPSEYSVKYILLKTLSQTKRTCIKEEELTMWIASEKQMFENEYGRERPFLMHKLKEEDEWSPLHHLMGFHHREGYEYEVLVKMNTIINPQITNYNKRYTLMDIISETKTER